MLVVVTVVPPLLLVFVLGCVSALCADWGVSGVLEFGECVVCGFPPGAVCEFDVVVLCVVVEVVECGEVGVCG